ncbi:hypothetical protein DFR29_106187 [Tahibacter aquaticus]|uniref:Uncharacterized protein n=1 Tax=Tahibacter aquaticus TaxID=520092 RepID=A0A4V3DME6_9GAMM|nr:hypothetical protein [Tahibacter aquaticus]TDR44040.1 hypothetical protein DFR29_106187 [Tahibacter aquaticus]
MKPASLLLAAVLAVAAGAVTAAPDPAVRARLVQILAEFTAISDIDIGNCDHEHAPFSTAYEALKDSPSAVAMHRVMAYYELKPESPATVDHNPGSERCLAALEKAKALFETHGDYIQKIAATLPPPAAAD